MKALAVLMLFAGATHAADPPRPAPPETDVTELPIAALRERAAAGNAAAQTLPWGPLALEGR